MTVTFTHTNESLNAIIAGLEPSPKDTILAVGGSGEQGLALLGLAGRVTIIDCEPAQIQYIRKRVEELQKYDWRSFLQQRADYFLTGDRLHQIREKLADLEIVEGDMFDFAQQQQGHSKVYLSNALGYGRVPNREYIQERLSRVAKNLSARGLVYVANHASLVEHSERTLFRYLHPGEDLSFTSFLPPELELDLSLSVKARQYQRSCWSPAVYRKV